MKKKYVVELSDVERQDLQEIVSKGQHAAYKIKHAHILLKADATGPGWTDAKISEAFACHPQTVRNLRERFSEGGLSSALERSKPAKPPRSPRLDGAGEARLIALSCSQPPEGFGGWTLRMLADKLVELSVVESISPETVRQTLKKRVETASSQAVGDPTGCGCGICFVYGRCAETLSTSARCAFSRREYG